MPGDLHTHSIISDGSIEPDCIVDLASRLGLSYVAVTDHDTMDGVGAALSCSKKAGVRVLPGLEVSTFDYKNGKKVHILCYFPKKPGPLLELCKKTLESRDEVGLEMIEKVSKLYPLSLDIVKKYAGKSSALYKQHMMLALMNMGYSQSVFGELYSEIFSSKTGWAYIPAKLPEARETIKVIKETGGAAVLAHPGVYGNFDILKELCELGLDGIEVHHPRQSKEDEKRAFEASREFNLIRTGGSDFHGMCASRVTALGAKTAEDCEIEKLIERFG